jgi:hypothetical protein
MSATPRPQQEPDALPTRYLVGVGVICVVVGVVAVLASGLPARPPAEAVLPREVPTAEEQRLLDEPARGLEIQSAQRAKLNEYGWVDHDAGVAQIPIDRAIDIVVDESR